MTTERRRNAPEKTSDLLQKGQTKKKGRSLNYEKQKNLGSTDGRADGTGKAQETVKAYLEGMNETQKDYFSFQWQQAVKTALALLNGDEDAAILEDAGDADFDLKAVDSAKTAEFNDAVIQLLSDAGVTNEWKNHTDVEPFLYATAIK